MANKYLTLEEKFRLIEVQEQKNLSLHDLIQLFGVTKKEVCDTLRDPEAIREQYKKLVSSLSWKKSRKTAANECTKYELINQLVWQWFQYAQARQIPISGPILLTEARIIAKSLKQKSFNASNNWLERFKKRHNILLITVCGEHFKTVVAMNERDWLKELVSLAAYYEPKDIFSCHECYLLYRDLEAFRIGEGKFREFSNVKEKITVLLCSNFAGEMAKPVIVGKQEEDIVMKTIKEKNLSVVWKQDNRACINLDIVREWLESFNMKMVFENRKVLLFLDSDYYMPDFNLSNINMVYYPAKTGEFSQPLDQGIVNCFRIHYRRTLLDYVEEKEISNPSKRVTILDAVECIATAAGHVKSQNIHNNFNKAGFNLKRGKKRKSFKKDEIPVKRICNRIALSLCSTTKSQTAVAETCNTAVSETCNTANDCSTKAVEIQNLHEMVKIEIETDSDVEKEEVSGKQICHGNTRNWCDNISSESVVAERPNTTDDCVTNDEEICNPHELVKVKLEIDSDVDINYSEQDSHHKMDYEQDDSHYKILPDNESFFKTHSVENDSHCQVESREDEIFGPPNVEKHHATTYKEALVYLQAVQDFAKRAYDHELLARTLQTRVVLESRLKTAEKESTY